MPNKLRLAPLICRDRAEERRRGVNPDYEGADQLASVLSTGDVNISKLSVEETKFLGGDIDHTHLVKGLDYALLQKVSQHPIAVRCISGLSSCRVCRLVW